MTEQQVKMLGLGIAPVDERVILVIASGLEWVKSNTTLDFDMNNDEDLKALPYCVRLFLVKFFDVQMLSTGVSSESIEGLSQSFDTGSKNAMIWQFAQELLSDYLVSCVKAVPYVNKWR
jgi:hypothetical protein